MSLSCVGIDIEEVGRFRVHSFLKDKRFWRNLFTTGELSYLKKFNDPYPHAAGTFAAKEAVQKACSRTHGKIALIDIEVRHEKSGRPTVRMRRAPKITCEISISHTRDFAIAAALCENTHNESRRNKRKN